MKNKIFIAVFLALTVGLWPLYLLTYGLWDHTNYENRNYITFEDIKNADFTEKSSMIDGFINDNAPFKNELTSLNAGRNLKLFGSLQSGEVLLGREDWLFLKNNHDSNSTDDYQGTNHYTSQQMETLAAKLAQLENILSARGVELKIIVAPNKEQVYSEYMPRDIPKLDVSKITVLQQYIPQEVEFFYLPEYLKDTEETVYYRYDTHWNNLGALRMIQYRFDGFENAVYEKTDDKPLMDLANVSGIYNYVQPDSYYRVTTKAQHSGQKLYLLHDSFGDMMLPILADRYDVEHATFAYFADFSLPQDTDVLVIEICERYFYRIFNTIDTIIENAENMGR